MEVTKEKLERVLESLAFQRAKLPEFSAFGGENWKRIDVEEYYVRHMLNYGVLPKLEEEDDEYAYECYCWLDGEDNDFYEDCIADLEGYKNV